MDEPNAWVAARAQVDDGLLTRLAAAWPTRFAEALQWPITAGGKRFRPAVVFAAFEAARGADRPLAVAAAIAVELVHTYSLVHDDLPAMDDDDERRGRPTCHVRFGEAAAILVGDGLLTEAFAVLAEAPGPAATRIQMVAALARAAGNHGMVGGQAADVGLGGPIGDVEDLVRLHRGKTGALIRASAELGGMAAGIDEGGLTALRAWGEEVGLAFQLIDDVLDADEAKDQDGPPSFVRLIGVDATRAWADACALRAEAAAARLPDPAPLNALARRAAARTA